MGKKGGSGKSYVSKGTGIKTTKASTLNAVKSKRAGWEREFNALKAWKKGGNPWVTIDNPNKNDLGAKQIRVRYSELKGGSFKDIEKKFYTV